MKAVVILSLIILGNIICQDNIKGVSYEENSFYNKAGQDKIILTDGNFYYGKFIEKSGGKITFHCEFETSNDIFKIKEIKLLVLANGKTIVRDRKTFLPIFFGISAYFIFYFSLLLNI